MVVDILLCSLGCVAFLFFFGLRSTLGVFLFFCLTEPFYLEFHSCSFYGAID